MTEEFFDLTITFFKNLSNSAQVIIFLAMLGVIIWMIWRRFAEKYRVRNLEREVVELKSDLKTTPHSTWCSRESGTRDLRYSK